MPAHGASNGGEAATIEYAVTALGIQDIIVCGHSRCGAIKGLLQPRSLTNMPCVSRWLQHAEAARQVITETCPDLNEEEQLLEATKQNVLVQINNLCTYPSVYARSAHGRLKIHGWIYMVETGEVLVHDPDSGQFHPLIGPPPKARDRARLASLANFGQ